MAPPSPVVLLCTNMSPSRYSGNFRRARCAAGVPPECGAIHASITPAVFRYGAILVRDEGAVGHVYAAARAIIVDGCVISDKGGVGDLRRVINVVAVDGACVAGEGAAVDGELAVAGRVDRAGAIPEVQCADGQVPGFDSQDVNLAVPGRSCAPGWLRYLRC